MTQRTRKIAIAASIAILATLYVSGPLVAGACKIGNRAGPKIYPMPVHEVLYQLAWTRDDFGGNQPRLAAVFRREYRPWFYGMYSKNDDPVWLKVEYEKMQERLAAARDTK